MRRVVVTGMGAVSCIGKSLDKITESLKLGRSGISYNENFREMGLRSQICGSVGRGSDFDRDFNPLEEHTKKRWLSIAAARLQGKTLPPVSLIRIGETYYVQDGHHRISVERAQGAKKVHARVTVAVKGLPA